MVIPSSGAEGQSQNVRAAGVWSSSQYDCLRDEETCWWGTWCCCLLASRTGEGFSAGSAFRHAAMFISSCILAVLLAAVGLGGLSILILIVSSVVYAAQRASVRLRIRESLSIPGDYLSDFFAHCLCSCCSVCQEAREEKLHNDKRLDFCFGEDLLTVEQAGEAVRSDENSSFYTHLKSVSKTAKAILAIAAVLALLCIIVLSVSDRSQNILILLLVFVQPFLILYFVYWQHKRKYASLDYVIKLFAVGFFLSTTQSIFFESILELVIGLAAGIILLLVSPSAFSNNNSDSSSGKENESINLQAELTTGIMHIVRNMMNIGNPLFRTDSDEYSQAYISSVDTKTVNDDPSSTFNESSLRDNFYLVVIVLFLMSFVVAAGVEETMKHFAIRCCKFATPLKDPHSVLVYMMTAALGFATSENIEYVFGTKSSPIPGTSLIVGELFVLLIRVLLPIHVICSVIQAANLSKVLMQQSSMSLIAILMPAIILHGSFDFSLFLLGAIQVAYHANGTVLTVFSFVISGALAIGGTIFAYIRFNKVLESYNDGYQRFDNVDDVMNVML